MTPAPWLHEFGVSRLEEHLQDQDSPAPRDVLCPSCNLYSNGHLPACPECASGHQ